MDKNWLKVIIAGVVEVGWVLGLKHATNVWQWGLTAVAIFISFYLLINASKALPVGTVYAVFVGIGTTGTVLADRLLFGEAISGVKLLFIVMLLAGVIGLKLATPDTKEEKEMR